MQCILFMKYFNCDNIVLHKRQVALYNSKTRRPHTVSCVYHAISYVQCGLVNFHMHVNNIPSNRLATCSSLRLKLTVHNNEAQE